MLFLQKWKSIYKKSPCCEHGLKSDLFFEINYFFIISKKRGYEMKKIIACLVFLSFFLAGCTKEDEGYDPFGSTAEERLEAEKSTSLESSSQNSSSSEVEVDFYVRSPSYNNSEKTATILGKSNEGDKVTVTGNGEELGSTIADSEGFSIKIDLPDNDDLKITVSNGKEEKEFDLLSKSNLESSESEIKEKYTGTDSYDLTEPSSSQQVSNSSNSSTSETSRESQLEITSPDSDQKELVVAWTQMDCADRNIKLTYEGKNKWKIATNYIDGVNKWIVTTNDKSYGRVKAIYEWDGDEKSGAKLIYLLVSGEEVVNEMN